MNNKTLKAGINYEMKDIDLDLVNIDSSEYKSLIDFYRSVGDENFPCLFARKSFKKKSIKFLFCKTKYDFLEGMIDFTNFVRSNEQIYIYLSPLVVIFSEEIYLKGLQHKIGWELLNWIHERDIEPWPNEIPTDPNDSNWTFCFNGVPLFINISSSDHKVLLSRNLGKDLYFIINPRANFDYVASVETKSGKLIRQQIRTRVAEYNSEEASKVLGFYGEKDNLEWKQYQLPEIDLPSPILCPFNFKK